MRIMTGGSADNAVCGENTMFCNKKTTRNRCTRFMKSESKKRFTRYDFGCFFRSSLVILSAS